MSDGTYPVKLTRRSPAERLAFLAAQRPGLVAAGWSVQQLAVVDQMILEARADAARGHGLAEFVDTVHRIIPPDVIKLGRERRRQDEIASGQLRIGNRWTWYASIRWSDQAWNVLHPIKLDRWVR